jgi:peptidyl-prolyl cis-trans isomerase C
MSDGRERLYRRWLREPLVRFLAVGLALFAVHRALAARRPPAEPPRRITLTDDDVRQMTLAWRAQGRPEPTREQLKSLIESRVREEVLSREAIVLGLDKGDVVIKRRLAQKMEFLGEDLSDVSDPRPETLRAWFDRNATRFAMPVRVSFRHLYFSPDRRGAHAREDAARALRWLTTTAPTPSDRVAVLGDPFMFQDAYTDRTFEQLGGLFGPEFAKFVVGLEPGAWRGPVESGYGWHLVWVEAVTPGRVPTFEEVQAEARTEWVAEQRAESKRTLFDMMRARYQVLLPAALTTSEEAPRRR